MIKLAIFSLDSLPLILVGAFILLLNTPAAYAEEKPSLLSGSPTLRLNGYLIDVQDKSSLDMVGKIDLAQCTKMFPTDRYFVAHANRCYALDSRGQAQAKEIFLDGRYRPVMVEVVGHFDALSCEKVSVDKMMDSSIQSETDF